MYFSPFHGGVAVSLLSWPHLSAAKSVNATIDDTNGDNRGNFITYMPVDEWNSGGDCRSCTARPDEAYLVDGTWHDTTFYSVPNGNNHPNTLLTASTQFNGTAVYVNCVLARTLVRPNGFSDMSFFIDGQPAGAFFKVPPGVDGYDYNVSVYSNTSLTPGLHTLIIQNGRINGNQSLLLLDSVVYTYDDGGDSSPVVNSNYTNSNSSNPSSSNNYPSPSSRSTQIGAIVGPVVGATVLVALAVLLFTLCRRRRRSVYAGVISRPSNGFDPTPRPLQLHSPLTRSAWPSNSQPLSHLQAPEPQRYEYSTASVPDTAPPAYAEQSSSGLAMPTRPRDDHKGSRGVEDTRPHRNSRG